MAEKPRRVALGFHAGGSLPLRLADETLEALHRALKSGSESWLEVDSEDGSVLVNLSQVIYLRVESDDHKIGF
jgi:hypothetical protein